MINAVTGSKVNYSETEEMIDMCVRFRKAERKARKMVGSREGL